MPPPDGIQPRPHVVVVLAPADVVPFDLSVPCDVFGHAFGPRGERLYDVRVCAETDVVDAGVVELVVRWGLDALDDADTVVIAGTRCIDRPLSPRAVAAVRRAAARGARVASVCTGAFLLAGTGLLDGRRATTHWRATDALAARFPAVAVDVDALYVDEGAVLTSAGAAAALDLCLHMVRTDHGAAVAADTARQSVMPLERAGGQSQFVTRPAPTDTDALAPLLAWVEAHLADDLSLPDLARAAHTSVRTLNRRFRRQLGVSPLQWLIHARVRHAQALLETTALDIEQIAAASGFGSTPTFRQHFKRLVSVSPSRWRQEWSRRPHAEGHSDGAPAANQPASSVSQMAQPNDDKGSRPTMGSPTT